MTPLSSDMRQFIQGSPIIFEGAVDPCLAHHCAVLTAGRAHSHSLQFPHRPSEARACDAQQLFLSMNINSDTIMKGCHR